MCLRHVRFSQTHGNNTFKANYAHTNELRVYALCHCSVNTINSTSSNTHWTYQFVHVVHAATHCTSGCLVTLLISVKTIGSLIADVIERLHLNCCWHGPSRCNAMMSTLLFGRILLEFFIFIWSILVCWSYKSKNQSGYFQRRVEDVCV